MTSSLDWNLVSDGLFWLLNGSGCHAQAFAEGFAAVTVSSEWNAAVNLMQCMLKKITSWCLETGLKVNREKTEQGYNYKET